MLSAREIQYNSAGKALEAVTEAVRTCSSDADLGALEAEFNTALDEFKRCEGNMKLEDELRHVQRFTPTATDLHEIPMVELRADQSVAEHVRERISTPGPDERVSLGKLLRGMATGRWDGAAAEQRVMAEGAIGTGGAMVPEYLAAELIDIARAKAVAISAGARTITLQTSKTDYARLTGEPAGAWRAENEPLNDEELTFDRVTFNAKTFAILVKAPVELVADAINFENAVANSFGKVTALKLDYAALVGGSDTSGVTPVGIQNTASVGSVDADVTGAVLTDYDPFLDAIGTVRAHNFEPNAVAGNPEVFTQLSKLKDSMLNPMKAPLDYAALAAFPSTQIPFAGVPATTSAIVGQFNELLIGIHTDGMIFKVLDQAFMADNLNIGFICYMRADVKLAHPEAFCKVNNITAATL